jgi:hypothetical protein
VDGVPTVRRKVGAVNKYFDENGNVIVAKGKQVEVLPQQAAPEPVTAPEPAPVVEQPPAAKNLHD